jgi:hypothetical protein
VLWFASNNAIRVILTLRAFRTHSVLKGLNAPPWSRLIDRSFQLAINFIYLTYPQLLGVLWFAKIPAIRSNFALRALRSLRELKGLNARPLAFSRQVEPKAP